MIYLDNAATSFPKAPGVAEAMARFINESAGNPGRAGHRLALAAERVLEDTRAKLARFFDGQEPQRMVLAMNGTDALNMAIKGVLAGEPEGVHVITTVLEHNSVSRPLMGLREAGRIDLTRVDCDGQGFVDPDEIRKAIRPNTALIVMTHASNVLGTIQDAAAVGAIAREANVLFCLDAAQTAGLVPISIREMNIDLLAFPGHKALLGPTGTGGLYVGPRCPEPPEAVASGGATSEAGELWHPVGRASRLPSAPRAEAGAPPTDDLAPTGQRQAGRLPHPLAAWREGGTGGDSAYPTQPALFPYYLEGGTPNTVGLAGLAAALDFLGQHSMEATLAREQTLIQAIVDQLRGDKRFVIHGPAESPKRAGTQGCVGTLSLNITGQDPAMVAAILDDTFSIAVRAGLHCAPYIHRKLGTFPDGSIRISVGAFTTDRDVTALVGGLREIAGV